MNLASSWVSSERFIAGLLSAWQAGWTGSTLPTPSPVRLPAGRPLASTARHPVTAERVLVTAKRQLDIPAQRQLDIPAQLLLRRAACLTGHHRPARSRAGGQQFA
jgi:hypothetical protein